MEHQIHSALPALARDLQFCVEKISSTDHYYTDGSSVGSFLKLVLVRKDTQASLYFFPSGKYIAIGTLTREEESILDGWMAMVKSRKIERLGF